MEEVRPIFQECFRVLKKGGVLLCGLDNGINYLFDDDATVVRRGLPYNPLKDPCLLYTSRWLRATSWAGVIFARVMRITCKMLMPRTIFHKSFSEKPGRFGALAGGAIKARISSSIASPPGASISAPRVSRMLNRPAGSVSYTHLDVYKRQDLHMLFGASCALAELAQALPGEIETTVPLRLSLIHICLRSMPGINANAESRIG